MKRASSSILILILLLSCETKGQDGFHKIKSNHTVDETVANLTNLLKQKGMNIFATINHQKGAINSGLDLLPTTLIIFGNPKVGTRLMQCDQRIGLDLPLKMLIWQDDNGATWIGYSDPANLKNIYNLDACVETLEKVKNAISNFALAAAS